MGVIVLVEDQYENARLARRLLEAAGHVVHVAVDGEAGLTAIFDVRPDLVLMDLGLPDIDGQTVIGILRQEASMKHVPLVAFTAYPEQIAHDLGAAYGCSGVISKPIDTRRFVAQVNAFMETSHAE